MIDSLHSQSRVDIARTYRIQTNTMTTVREQTVSNAITTTFRLSRYGRTPDGTDALLLELLDFRQTDQSPLSGLLADLNPVNNRLLFEISPYGDLLALRNVTQVQEQWLGLRPQIVAKYGRTSDGMVFINGFEQQLNAERLLANFRHKGAYGLLLPGLFGVTGTVREGLSERLLTGFFGTVDLPLLLQTEVTQTPDLPGGRRLRVTGQVDENRFDEQGLRRLIREVVDMPNFRVAWRVNCDETYDLDAGHWLTAARQELTFVVENIYYQHTSHQLTQL